MTPQEIAQKVRSENFVAVELMVQGAQDTRADTPETMKSALEFLGVVNALRKEATAYLQACERAKGILENTIKQASVNKSNAQVWDEL